MSSVLDALRRGRGPHAAPPDGDPAQTDAVLHTLGYRQTGQVSPLKQILRAVAILAAASLVLGAWALVKFVSVR